MQASAAARPGPATLAAELYFQELLRTLRPYPGSEFQGLFIGNTELANVVDGIAFADLSQIDFAALADQVLGAGLYPGMYRLAGAAEHLFQDGYVDHAAIPAARDTVFTRDLRGHTKVL